MARSPDHRFLLSLGSPHPERRRVPARHPERSRRTLCLMLAFTSAGDAGSPRTRCWFLGCRDRSRRILCFAFGCVALAVPCPPSPRALLLLGGKFAGSSM